MPLFSSLRHYDNMHYQLSRAIERASMIAIDIAAFDADMLPRFICLILLYDTPPPPLLR